MYDLIYCGINVTVVCIPFIDTFVVINVDGVPSSICADMKCAQLIPTAKIFLLLSTNIKKHSLSPMYNFISQTICHSFLGTHEKITFHVHTEIFKSFACGIMLNIDFCQIAFHL